MALNFLYLLLFCALHGAYGFRRPEIRTSRGSKIFGKVAWHPCWTVGIYESPDRSASTEVKENSSDEKSEAVSASCNAVPSGKRPKSRKTAGKFSKYAPPSHKAESMDSVEFRQNVYSAMKKAEEERKESQGGKVGAMISDSYLDGLDSGRRAPRSRSPRKYGISGSWVPEQHANTPSKSNM